ncbi:MAG: DUF72 domain-containing protein [Sulfolobales archaeon]|nr:DUF72 domain-containing protein [Sulfolobales archaeon]MDW8083177.1 DUF72 domain-containing protein [Sulfolobales archaeon]
MKLVFAGCCGYCLSRSKYYSMFKVVELQETFYDLLSNERLKLLREEAPKDFVFNIKAYQGVTHDLNSPTWRRSKKKPGEYLKDKIGLLRPTRENLELWEEVVREARMLRARVVVVQTPPSFGYSNENFRNAVDFFSVAVQEEFVVGWEPRGSWLENLHAVKKIVESYSNIVHVVDIFRVKPVVVKEVSYIRLHGIGGREVNYSYRYTNEDLRTLCDMIDELAGSSREIYVMFNNASMAVDAQHFISTCSTR